MTTRVTQHSCIFQLNETKHIDQNKGTSSRKHAWLLTFPDSCEQRGKLLPQMENTTNRYPLNKPLTHLRKIEMKIWQMKPTFLKVAESTCISCAWDQAQTSKWPRDRQPVYLVNIKSGCGTALVMSSHQIYMQIALQCHKLPPTSPPERFSCKICLSEKVPFSFVFVVSFRRTRM